MHLIEIDSFSKMKLVITSVSLHCIATVIVYTRSMFISLRLSSELISGVFFPETVYFLTRKETDLFCSENTRKLG